MEPHRGVLPMLVFMSALMLLSNGASSQVNKESNDALAKVGSELDGYFTSVVAAQKYVGLGACLVKGDEIVWEGSYGYADREEKTLLRSDAIFQLMSVSKTVTATALMQLYEKGLFNLDDDINAYMPIQMRNPNFPERPITFRMLLTHRAGFADVLPAGVKIAMGVAGDSPLPLAEFVEGVLTSGGKYYSVDYFSTSEPGTKYEYSNVSFALIGYLVEKIARKDFSDYCKENIFKPLGMDNTGWHLRDLDTNRIVFGYVLSPSDTLSYRKIRHFGEPGYPAGNLRTTMQDFARFVSAFTHNGTYRGFQMLQPQTVALMLAPQGVDAIPSRSFKIVDIGLTWLINDVDGTLLHSMNGFAPSMFTDVMFSVKNRTGFIFYFTGINMKNMSAMIDIVRHLQTALNAIG